MNNEKLKMSERMGATSRAVSLRTQQGITSGPEAFDDLTLLSSFSTPCGSTLNRQ